jgi:endoglucanase
MPKHAAPGRRVFPVVLLALALVAAGVVVLARRSAGTPVVIGQTTPPSVPQLYVDPSGAAITQLAALQGTGRAADIAALRRIAEQPTATWFADDSPGYAQRARSLAAAATAAGKLPVLTLYNIPDRDCAGQSAGGAADAAAYQAWVRALAGALTGHRALIVLEPDAIPQAVQGCLSRKDTAERYGLLAGAVDALRANPGVRVYLDAGNPSWVTEPARMTAALRRAGITRAAGFALNVANFETTADNVAYGGRLSALLGGAHFVVDTSRNGNGPARKGAGDQHWCNPPGRALGEAPTLRTGEPLADAYLWVKRPGESDGACSDGAPPAGQWWLGAALALANG